jgi:hypothetical protein
MQPSKNPMPSVETDGFVLLGDAPETAAEPPLRAEPEQRHSESEDDPSELDVEVPERVLLMDALFTELEPVDPEQIVLTLTGSASARLAGRAAFLGMIGADDAAGAAQERDWQALLVAGLSAGQLALLVRAEAWLPPVHHGLPFCQWLVSQAVLDQDRLDALFDRSIQLGWPIFQVALEDGALDEATYVDQLARFCGLEQAQPPRGIPRAVLVSFPVGWVEHFELVPLARGDAGFVVASATYLPTALVARLAADLGCPVEIQLAAPAAVATWRRRWLRHWWRMHHAGRGSMDQG